MKLQIVKIYRTNTQQYKVMIIIRTSNPNHLRIIKRAFHNLQIEKKNKNVFGVVRNYRGLNYDIL